MYVVDLVEIFDIPMVRCDWGGWMGYCKYISMSAGGVGGFVSKKLPRCYSIKQSGGGVSIAYTCNVCLGTSRCKLVHT